MTNWRKKIAIKHLLTEKEDLASVQERMNKVADVLSSHFEFRSLLKKLRKIPKGDEFFKPVDYANKILDELYSIADEYSIWIE